MFDVSVFHIVFEYSLCISQFVQTLWWGCVLENDVLKYNFSDLRLIVNTTQLLGTMASVRTSILLRALARNVSYTPRNIAPSRLVQYVRPHSSLQPLPCIRANIRFYSTTPPDDFKVYTFKEVAIILLGLI